MLSQGSTNRNHITKSARLKFLDYIISHLTEMLTLYLLLSVTRLNSNQATYSEALLNPIEILTLCLLLNANYFASAQTISSEASFNPGENNYNDYHFTSSAIVKYTDSMVTISNVKDLTQANYIFLGNTHSNFTHLLMIQDIIAELGEVNDIVHFEGIDHIFPCRLFGSAYIYSTEQYEPGTYNLSLLRISDKFICRGWDNSKFLPDVRKVETIVTSTMNEMKNTNQKLNIIMTLMPKISNILKKIKAIQDNSSIFLKSNDKTIHEDFKTILQSIIMENKKYSILSNESVNLIKESLRKCNQGIHQLKKDKINSSVSYNIVDIVNDIENLISISNTLEKETSKKPGEIRHILTTMPSKDLILTKRNAEGLISAINEHKNKKFKKFFIGGSDHFQKNNHPNSKDDIRNDVLDQVKDSKYAVFIMRIKS